MDRLVAVRTPGCTHPGLGSCRFARRYSGNRCFFLFLRLLRCFSSPGSPPHLMDWDAAGRSLSCRVSPFRHLRIGEYLPLPAAFRSLSRLSSALSAKASTLRSCCFFSDLLSSARSIGIGRLSWFLGLFSRMSCTVLVLFRAFARRSLSVFGFQGACCNSCLLDARQKLRCYRSARISRADGLKWTRTTDLTLIRRAL